MKVHNDIMLALDRKRDVLLVMLDLSAAFETIDHEILLHRLEYFFGFRGPVLAWFRSYLVDRKQYVSIPSHGDTASSNSKSVYTSSQSTPLCGVPQGTILGPILFTLYTAPLEEILLRHGLDPMIFADDSQSYITCEHYSEAQPGLERCIDEVKQWMRDNMLILNDSKTEVIHFKSKFKKDRNRIPSLRIGDSEVDPVSVVRNLGVYFDDAGKMSDNLKQICQTASYGLWRIGKIRNLLDRTLTERLVHAFITSRLDYCNALLHGLDKCALLPLQTIQNSAARMITLSKRNEHITPILYELHWLPIHQRTKFKILITAFKCLYEMAPSYLTELITPRTPPSSLRPRPLTLKTVRTNNLKHYGPTAFSVAAPLLWNALPPTLRSLTDFSTFKSQLKTHLFRQHYEYNDDF